MTELIANLNDLFGSETTDEDQLVSVNHVIKGKLLESNTLQQQAAHNTKVQFANSPDLNEESVHAIVDALDTHTSMSTRVLNSTEVQRELKGTSFKSCSFVGSASRVSAGRTGLKNSLV